jgi:hypothetical protein
MVTKSLFTITFLLCVYCVNISAQCVSDAHSQCVPNETLNRMNKALDELAASRDLIVKLTAAQAASDAKNAAADAVIAKTNQILELDTKMIGSYDKVIALYQDTIKLYADLVEKLTTKLNAPKSAFAKFVGALREIAVLAAGILIGRGAIIR